MFILAIGEPSPAVGEAQVQAQFVERRVGFEKACAASRAAVGLGVEELLRQVERCAEQAGRHGGAKGARKGFAFWHQPLQQIEHAAKNHEVFHWYSLIPWCARLDLTNDRASLVEVSDWGNLLEAWRKAARGKRGKPGVASFEHQCADKLLAIQGALRDGSWRPGVYTNFQIHSPKTRLISAAPFADRVVHHALCNVIGPVFERRFIADSYANRAGKGTHRAVNRLQQFCQRYRYALRLDVVKHFPSIDHEILMAMLGGPIADEGILDLAAKIISSGDRVLEQEYQMVWFPGDDLFAALRPRGLPIGNLTSQFWSNCYMNAIDQFVQRELRCGAYLRYVDDMALFSDSKRQLWEWKAAVVERLQRLRLTIHESSAQAEPVSAGIPWLGFVVYPEYRRVKGRKVVEATGRLGDRFDAWQAGEISFGEFDSSVKGWINHVRYADTWGLRGQVLERLIWVPARLRRRTR